ncbi:alkaline phosphatase family protein [Hyphococcus sp.]|uniref:alkaline phosphatase family protein n=1 Tax=Hyphococcus sp. TaxID=2038636 RepID=UPI003CCC109C
MPAKVLFFGFDGLDHLRLDALIDEGVLPNFEKLRNRSHEAALGVYPGFGAGAFWASAATGVTPAHHGRYFFLQFNPKTYDSNPFHESYTYRKRAFWEDLDREGKKIAMIDWHRAPFSIVENGMVVDNWLGHDSPSGLKTSPSSLAKDILAEYGHDPIAGGYGSRKFENSDDHRAFAQGAVKRIEYKEKFCVDQLNAHDWDVFIPCFTELHDIGHYYMHLADPDHALFDPELRETIGDPIRDCYLALDKVIASISEAAGEDAAIMMLAGPGMEPLVSANAAIEDIALKLDLGFSPPVTTGRAARQTYRSFIPDRWRRKLSPIARRARQIFADSDYKRRRFFGVPHNDNAGCIRVNLKGREKYGVVSPGAEYDAVLEEIKDGLLSLKDAHTGAPAVDNVVFTRDQLDGPYLDDLPDVFAEWNRTNNKRNFKTLTSERTGDIHVPPHLRTGDHTRRGLFWSTQSDPFFTGNGLKMPHEVVALIGAALAKER